MITAHFTGHRPDKLLGYNPLDNKTLLWKLNEVIIDHIESKGVTTFITGMALGIDMWAAKIVLKLKEKYPDIKLVCAIPCQNHSGKWRTESKEEWQFIIDRADEVVFVSDEPYTVWCMQKRNEWMSDNSKLAIAVWDGTPGGTANCVKYAKDKIKITYINPKDYEKR